MKKVLFYLSLTALALNAGTALASPALAKAPIVAVRPPADYADGYELGQSVRASLLRDYNNNPHNLNFQAELQAEVDAARYQQTYSTPGSALYDYWDGYIAGITKR